MNVQEAAARLDVAVVSVRQAIRRGKLPARKVGDEWQLTEADVDAYGSAHRYRTSAKKEKG